MSAFDLIVLVGVSLAVLAAYFAWLFEDMREAERDRSLAALEWPAAQR